MKALLRELTPPLIWRQAQRVRTREDRPASGPYTGFDGDFTSWTAAQHAAGDGPGYEAQDIIENTIALRRLQIAGLEQHGHICPPGATRLLAALGVIFSDRALPATFRVLDLGGELGIHYWWVQPRLSSHTTLRWDICETPAMVRAGRKHFATEALRFFVDPRELARESYDLFYASGSLQYLPDPTAIFDLATALDVRYLFLDRLPLTTWDRDRLTVQHGDHPVPAWFFAEAPWLGRFDEAKLDVIMRCDAPEDVVILDSVKIAYQAVLLRRRPPNCTEPAYVRSATR
jgi:putative methyltransferase (TIGR04325 family)